MTAIEIFERYVKAPTTIKAAIVVGIAVVVGAVFYFLVYSDMQDEATKLEGQITTLQAEKSDYEEKKQKYMAFRAEVNKLLEEQKELLKVLPTDAKISSFLQSIHAQAELSGVTILTYEQRPEVRKEFYAEIPVRMIITGRFHQITKFFYSIQRSLKRIVKVQDVLLAEPQTTEQGVILKAQFVTNTYRFLGQEAGGPGGAVPATAPAGGKAGPGLQPIVPSVPTGGHS